MKRAEARAIQLTIRLKPSEAEAIRERAARDGLRMRTWIQRRLELLAEDTPDSRAVVGEVRKVSLLLTKLWLGGAQGPAARAEILRIVKSVESEALPQ